MVRRDATFDEDHVRWHYRLLGHEPYGVTELLAISDRAWNLVGFFDDEDDFVAACREWSGRRHVFVGVQPRRRELFDLAPNELRPLGQRARNTDASHITALFVDVDVKTPARDRAAASGPDGAASSTQDEVDAAVEMARRIASWKRLRGAISWVSGNGAHILVPLDLPATPENGGRLAAFTKEIDARFSEDLRQHNLVIDSTADLARVMTVAGTMKLKGRSSSKRPHRLAAFLDGKPRRTVSQRLCRHVESLEPIALPRSVQLGKVRLQSSKDFKAPSQLCPAWAEVFETIAYDAEKRRYPVLRMLATALRHCGYDFDSIRDAVVLHDLHLGGKLIEEHSNPDRFVRSVLDAGADLEPTYLCKTVPDVLGHDQPCLNCTMRAAKSSGRSKFVRTASSSPTRSTETVETLTKDEARAEVEGAVKDWVRGVLAGKPSKPLLVKAGTGIGKTYLTLSTVASELDVPDRAPRRFVFLVDTRARMAEVVEELHRIPEAEDILANIVQIRGKVDYTKDGRVDAERSLCRKAGRVDYLRKMGYGSSERAMSCVVCLVRRNCPYLAQFKATDKSWIMTLDYMFTDRIEHGNDSAFVVCDESFFARALKNQIEVSVKNIRDLKKSLRAVGYKDASLREFLDALIKVIEEGEASGIEVRSKLLLAFPDLAELCQRLNTSAPLWDAVERIEEGDVTTLPKRFLKTLLDILAEEESQGAANSRLSIKERKTSKLVITGLRPVMVERPILILDATGDRELYEKVLGVSVDVVEPMVPRVWIAAGARRWVEDGSPSIQHDADYTPRRQETHGQRASGTE